MNLLINFTIGIILSIIDLYLIHYYINNLFPENIKNFKSISSIFLTYFFTFILLLLSNYTFKPYIIKIVLYIFSILLISNYKFKKSF